MVTLMDLPRELLDAILLQAVLVRGVKMGLRLRLVTREQYVFAPREFPLLQQFTPCNEMVGNTERFAIDVKQALFVSQLLDITKCHDPVFLKACFMYQILSDRKNTITPLRAIRRIAEILCEEAGQSGNDALRTSVESFCSLTMRQGQVHYFDDSWSKITQHDEDFENHVLVASAHMSCVPLLKRLLEKLGVPPKCSLLFGNLHKQPLSEETTRPSYLC